MPQCRQWCVRSGLTILQCSHHRGIVDTPGTGLGIRETLATGSVEEGGEWGDDSVDWSDCRGGAFDFGKTAALGDGPPPRENEKSCSEGWASRMGAAPSKLCRKPGPWGDWDGRALPMKCGKACPSATGSRAPPKNSGKSCPSGT